MKKNPPPREGHSFFKDTDPFLVLFHYFLCPYGDRVEGVCLLQFFFSFVCVCRLKLDRMRGGLPVWMSKNSFTCSEFRVN